MTNGATPRVSLVIPVHDAGPYLRPCLESVVAQDMPERDLQVIAVDDGSTDGSGAVLDEYAAARPNFRVIHQENSGWPGRPRNVGLGFAEGRYVFFLDADDLLDPRAMRRLADFADEHGSDVVVPKMVGIGGRSVAEDVYADTCEDADRVLVFATLTPAKLFRRDFMEEQRLRFPEGRVRLEDGMLMAKAYLTAQRVSVLAGHDCYFLRKRDDGGNISYDLGDPEEYVAGVRGVLDVAREHARDEDLAEAITLALYSRKALKQLRPGRYFAEAPERQRRWAEAVGELARSHVPVHVEERLSLPLRLRSRLVRHDERPALEALLREQQAGREPPARVRAGRVLLELPGENLAALDVTADVALEAGLTHLRVAPGHVAVRGEVRLRGVRVRRLHLALEGGRRNATGSEKLVAEARTGAAWCWFEARLDAGEWARPRRGTELSLRLAVRRGADLVARLAALPPAGTDDGEEPPRWSPGPGALRRTAGAAIARIPPARRLYRLLNRSGKPS